MTTTAVFDVGPVRCSGAFRTVTRSRVFWLDGWLYICQAANNVERVETLPPEENGQGWVAQTLDGDKVLFSRKGCPACGYQLGRLDRDKLIAVAHGELKKAAP